MLFKPDFLVFIHLDDFAVFHVDGQGTELYGSYDFINLFQFFRVSWRFIDDDRAVQVNLPVLFLFTYL